MKITRKITAIVLAVVLMLTMITPTLAASINPIRTRSGYAAFLTVKSGKPALSSEEFLGIYNKISSFFRIFTNGKFPTSEKLDVSYDEFLLVANHHILSSSGLDMAALISNFPPLNINIGYVTEKFEIDTTAAREAMYALRDECYAKGEYDLANVYYFVGVYVSIIDKAYFYAVPTPANENIYEVYLELTYRDGLTESFSTGTLVDAVTGEIYGRGGNGIFGFGFNFNMNEMMIYALVNAWHRNFGFAVLYDIAADILPVWEIITRRYYFEYNGLEWLIQAWKGSYFMTATGSEVGVYNRVPGEEMGTFYNCATDDQLMNMTMRLSHEDTVLLDLGPEKHWWINGFKMNGLLYEPENLLLEFSIEMPDIDMTNAFVKAVEEESNKDTTYTVDGTTVSVVWPAK